MHPYMKAVKCLGSKHFSSLVNSNCFTEQHSTRLPLVVLLRTVHHVLGLRLNYERLDTVFSLGYINRADG